ncbi:popeye domain-containing protein 3 [Caerostris extrusa]|uniref:Popeye domain-containing protein 3 n=1 Tax=Caerostris extrusa TaxID=172846 RepID=A0AAV4RQ70_CAEEX|nr:popeye domain-containing protein 3 [Caerostris extrusa]
MLNLHPGEAYAMQGLTRTDRLGLLIKGKANVISGQHFLHQIQANEFLDSPEFESSRSGVEEKFKVSIIATTPCRAVVWQRQSLEYLLIKETHLSISWRCFLSTDITKKLLHERQDGDRERFPLGYPTSKFHPDQSLPMKRPRKSQNQVLILI